MKLMKLSEENSSEFFSNLFLVFMSFVNPLIMLNILLALCADNYNSSIESAISQDYKELSLIILRVEELLFCKRKKNSLEYLQICSPINKIEMNKFKKLSKIIKNVQNEQENNKLEVLTKLQGFEMKVKNLENLLLEINHSQLKHKKRA